MKLKKPLSDKELETFEASRDMGKELLKSARQMVAKKGRVVLSPVIPARKNPGFHRQNLPNY